MDVSFQCYNPIIQGESMQRRFFLVLCLKWFSVTISVFPGFIFCHFPSHFYLIFFNFVVIVFAVICQHDLVLLLLSPQ